MPDDTKLPPPSGDAQRAEGYINQLIPLISQSKLQVTHTDLSKFDPSSLHDHYSLDLKDYQIEVSHTKQPNTGRDSYVLLFNNLKNISSAQTEKEILAYLIISEEQFKKIKDVAEEQIETLKKIEEEKRFKTAMTPVDELIDKIAKGEVDLSQKAQTVPNLPDEKPTEVKTEKPAADLEDEPKEQTPKSEQPEGIKNIDSFFTNTEPTQTDTSAPPLPHETTRTDAIPTVEESPDPVEEPPIQEVDTTAQKPPEQISALAAAAAMPLPEKPLDPTKPHEEPVEPSISREEPSPQPPTAPAEEQHSFSPPPAPTMTIEEVQKALQKAYEQSPQQPPPPEYRPGLGQIPTQNPTPAMAPTTIDVPASNGLGANPPIDQAIDQAFSPADNSMLSQAPKV